MARKGYRPLILKITQKNGEYQCQSIETTLDENPSYGCRGSAANCSTRWNSLRSQPSKACQWTETNSTRQFQRQPDMPQAGPSSPAVAHVLGKRDDSRQSVTDTDGQSDNRQLGDWSPIGTAYRGSSTGKAQSPSSPKESLDEYTAGYAFKCGFCNHYAWKKRLASSFAFCDDCHDWNRTSASLIGPGEDCGDDDRGAIIDIRDQRR